MSPAPEVYIEERKPEEDEFLVLACDGIWDVMSNEDLCQFVQHQLTITDDLAKVSASVVDYCLFKVLIFFIRASPSSIDLYLLNSILNIVPRTGEPRQHEHSLDCFSCSA